MGTMRVPRKVLDYRSITSNRAKQGLSITSILTTRIEHNASPPPCHSSSNPKHWTLMLSGVDRYLRFVLMTTAMIYDHHRGIMFMKKFMESLNYVTNRAARPESIIIHQKGSIEDGASTEYRVLIYNTFTDCGIWMRRFVPYFPI